MITCYDTSQALLADLANIDTVLVGDSCANVMMGLPNTNQITLDAIIHHTRAVSRGLQRAYLIGDMPFGTYLTINDAVRNAGRLIAEGGASMVKLEGYVPGSVKEISRFVPVCSHLGLLPQTDDCFGTRGRTYRDIKELSYQALKLQEAGASMLVLEKVCTETAAYISKLLEIPTIGIGSGPHCNGQVLVWHDMLGLGDPSLSTYKFVKRYTNLAPSIVAAISEYVGEVKGGAFPSPQHSYYLSDKTRDKLKGDDEIWDGLDMTFEEFFDKIKEGHEYLYCARDHGEDGNDNDPVKIERFRQLLPSQRQRKFTRIIKSAAELRNIRNGMDSDNDQHHRKNIVFVPFLGGLHDGHLALIEEAKKYESTHQIWCSLFLNPLQFNELNDYLKYPYNMDEDIEKLTKMGVDLIFTPSVSDMYPCYNVQSNRNENQLFGAYVDFENVEKDSAEGIARPGHFKGVGTVVTKLFSWVRPQRSVFGQKDFMQCVLIKNLCREFFPDTQIIVHPTMRETDGLAMSSRNNKLTATERARAPLIYECLCVMASYLFDNLQNEEPIPMETLKQIGGQFAEKHNVKLEYISFHDFNTGERLDNAVGDVKKFLLEQNEMVISIAGSVGDSTRLIDNVVVGKQNDKWWDAIKHVSLTSCFDGKPN
eukprot:CAMPEP_0197032334 /NCGR_PEP_ID=MMETSP1384-20130603/11037_1 /TAXON_ID=29189 /ORGANISM="Ammonia sp." /LENGTH=649 /DNA_ID=CAMNT_0042461977 /DNA_START=348 /DNA_END=2297 /DNA_ORIENTATION=+